MPINEAIGSRKIGISQLTTTDMMHQFTIMAIRNTSVRGGVILKKASGLKFVKDFSKSYARGRGDATIEMMHIETERTDSFNATENLPGRA